MPSFFAPSALPPADLESNCPRSPEPGAPMAAQPRGPQAPLLVDFIEAYPPAPGEHGPIGVRIELLEGRAVRQRPIQGPAPAGPLHFAADLVLPAGVEAVYAVEEPRQGRLLPQTPGRNHALLALSLGLQTYNSSSFGWPKFWVLQMALALGIDVAMAAALEDAPFRLRPGPLSRAAVLGTVVGLAKRSYWGS